MKEYRLETVVLALKSSAIFCGANGLLALCCGLYLGDGIAEILLPFAAIGLAFCPIMLTLGRSLQSKGAFYRVTDRVVARMREWIANGP